MGRASEGRSERNHRGRERERKSERRAREKGGERMTKRERGALKLLSATHRVFYCFPRL